MQFDSLHFAWDWRTWLVGFVLEPHFKAKHGSIWELTVVLFCLHCRMTWRTGDARLEKKK